MDLTLSNLKDLDYICEVAAEYFESRVESPKEIEWLARITRYQLLIQFEIERLEATYDVRSFTELIGILHTEDLLRLQRRSELQHNPALAKILGHEIAERTAIEAAQQQESK